MSDNLRSKTALVFDNGIFAEIAVTLAKDFGRVLYYVPWTNAYPKSNALLIGHGVEGIERVSSPWPYFDDIDIWIFRAAGMACGAGQTRLGLSDGCRA